MNVYKIVLGNTDTDIEIGATDELGRRLIGVDKNGWEEWLVLIEPDMDAALNAHNVGLENALVEQLDQRIKSVVEAALGGLL